MAAGGVIWDSKDERSRPSSNAKPWSCRNSGATIQQVADDLGIGARMLGKWRRALRDEIDKPFPGRGIARDNAATRLKRKLAQVKRERNFYETQWRSSRKSRSDISREGWLYLSMVLDLATDDVVGWSMSSCQNTNLAIEAVMMAVYQRESAEQTILHSDRGTQFTSFAYQDYLKNNGLICSMSAVGSYADNATAEGFFGRLKRERVNRRSYQTRREARTDVFDYIERCAQF